MAVVGVLTMELRIEHAQSLKEKRHVVRSLNDRLRNKFNVSVVEIDDQAALGVYCVIGHIIMNKRFEVLSIFFGMEADSFCSEQALGDFGMVGCMFGRN